MQETLRDQPNAADLRLRIGVNTGEVLVGALRSGGDYTAMGDVVNTAQRLQSAARPGQVLVGAATHVAAGDRITYEALGPLRVRGRDERVEAWLAVDTLQPPGGRTQRVDGPLVGRRSEMAVLTGEVDLAVSRRRAQMILLVGDAGMGKTRLARELSDLRGRPPRRLGVGGALCSLWRGQRVVAGRRSAATGHRAARVTPRPTRHGRRSRG